MFFESTYKYSIICIKLVYVDFTSKNFGPLSIYSYLHFFAQKMKHVVNEVDYVGYLQYLLIRIFSFDR
jgi:hypothetical protein